MIKAPVGGVAKYALPGKKKRVAGQALCALAGLFIGVINGVFGAGGGMLAVPALTGILGLEDKKAHATAIAVILPLCLISSVVYSVRASYDMGVVLPTILGVVLGGILGAALLKVVPGKWLGFIFYGIMLLAGIKMIIA